MNICSNRINMGRKAEIAKEILYAASLVGVLTVAILAPNALQMFKFLPGLSNHERKAKFKRSLKKLEKNKLISLKESPGGEIEEKLTKNGEEKLLKYKVEDMTVKISPKCDKKWRLVIFDVPNRLNKNRLAFTRKLKEMGLIYFQRSVWICPYYCEEEIDFLKEIYRIGPFVRFAVVDKFDIQFDLVKKFGLT